MKQIQISLTFSATEEVNSGHFSKLITEAVKEAISLTPEVQLLKSLYTEYKPKSVNEKKNWAIHQIISQFFMVGSESEAVDTYNELKSFVKEDKYLCAVHAFENIAQPFEDMVLSTLLEIVEAGIESVLAGGKSGN